MNNKKRKLKKVALKWKKQQVRRKPSVEDLLVKIERLCVNQPLYKMSIVLGISELELKQIFDDAGVGVIMSSRLPEEDFNKVKPLIAINLKEALDALPDKEIVLRSKGRSSERKASTAYSKLVSHKGFISFVNSNM